MPCEHSAVFADYSNPTVDEVRAWAYSGEDEPSQDFDLLFAHLDFLPLLLELVSDQDCPVRTLMLEVLYCTFGHSKPEWGDPRLREAISVAGKSADPWLVTWAARATRVLEYPKRFDRSDWCSYQGYPATPTG
ncbi:hypothetical protein UK23_23630 [Lentzea aerocolonigenes]|uniref:Uncharacterized protein n=1 Tax=Lentzea aerocolonigenes TaxID=68170 RepID=A0A0F0GSN6_LENAE|nr:hypothetical protein UK23_23630 [Lentzea aerocolonigenes]